MKNCLKTGSGGRCSDSKWDKASSVDSIPSSCGMLVYKETTSIVANIVLCFRGVGMEKIWLRKWLVSLMYEEVCETKGWR